MSYLDVPRLHFFGSFTADPSTLNNIPGNYSVPPDQIGQVGPQGGNNWNPNGTHSWVLEGCTVQTVIGPDGSSLQDPLVGTPVSSAGTLPSPPPCTYSPPSGPQRSNPKLVDLDTDQQNVSMIFGLQIQIGDSSSGTVTGTFQPQPFLDIYGGASNGGAYYQSVLQDLTWSPNLTSPVLQELQKISPDALSIKFNLMANVNGLQDGNPKPGSITGTIGPVSSGELANFLPNGRLMRPTAPVGSPAGHTQSPQSDNPPFNYTPFVVDSQRGKVIVDFGNTFTWSFPTSANIPEQDGSLGIMQVAIVPSQGSPQVLGQVEEYTAAAYQATAAIQEFGVTAEQISLLQGSSLAVLIEGSQILAEDENATYLGLTPIVCRLDPGDSAPISLVALSFGAPAANQPIDIGVSVLGSPQNNIQPGSVLQLTDVNGEPLTSVTTDANGQASFTLTAIQGPGNPRGPIDGQVYGIGFSWGLQPNPDPSVFVSVHVYDAFTVPDSPDWETDVLPILQPYADLYPFMANLLDLSNQEQVLQFAEYITCRMSLPITDPRYMPVTRDLSTAKKQTVLKWLAQNAPSSQGGTTGE